MTVQLSTAVRDAMNEAYEATVNGQTLSAGTGAGGSLTGTAAAPRLRLLTGAMPATPGDAQTGTLVAEINLPADWAAASAAGVKNQAGTWQVAAASSGTVGYYRIVNNAGTVCHEQGLVSQQVQLNTSALTAVNGNVLTFAATTGVVVGMNVVGTGIPANATAVAVTGTSVTLSHTSTAGVANGAAITFRQDLWLDNVVVNSGQVVTISSKSITAPNA